jgi:hypothetical protein
MLFMYRRTPSALLLGSALGFTATACLFPGAWEAEEECPETVATVPPGESYTERRTGMVVDVEAHASRVNGSWSGTLRYEYADADTIVAVALIRHADEPATVYCGCEYLGLEVPATLSITTDDGSLAERFSGIVALDSGGEALTVSSLIMPLHDFPGVVWPEEHAGEGYGDYLAIRFVHDGTSLRAVEDLFHESRLVLTQRQPDGWLELATATLHKDGR